ncbi:MAG: hypothetical protein C0620_03155 [Desulfuromonas sp.]|nr:MAG: hypothetical protein C0620_03155 [Desulfuromonas sp.]
MLKGELSRNMVMALVTVVMVLAALLVASGGQAQQDKIWVHESTEEGIALYHQQDAPEGLLPFKAVAVLDVPSDQIVLALLDAEGKPLWAPKLKSTTVHATLSPNRFLYSEYYTTPWPFKDREFLLLGTVAMADDSIVFSAVDARDRHYREPSHVQANIHELTFVIMPLSADRTRVEFTFSGDLGGWIPDFVQEIIQKRWPVRFIQALQGYLQNHQLVASERYLQLQQASPSP